MTWFYIVFWAVLFTAFCLWRARKLERKYMTAEPHICDRSMWEEQPQTTDEITGATLYKCPRCGNNEIRNTWSSGWLEYYDESSTKKKKNK